MPSPPEPAAVLLDLDGVLYVGEEPIPGAPEAVRALRQRGLPLRFVTNTTTRPRSHLQRKLRRLGVDTDPSEVFTPPVLARRWLDRHGGGPYRLLGPEALSEDLGPGTVSARDPQRARWVVLALHPPALDHDALTQAMRDLHAGAGLLALHINRTWVRPGGLAVGLGAYVRALEYAAEVSATVIGKPARPFFDEALRSLPAAARSAAWMVGDGLEGDIAGAQAAGLRGALVLSGKTDRARLSRGDIVPDAVAVDLGAWVASL